MSKPTLGPTQTPFRRAVRDGENTAAFIPEFKIECSYTTVFLVCLHCVDMNVFMLCVTSCIFWEELNVKHSRNRPGVAQRVPWVLGSQISWHLSRESGEVVRFTHRPPLPSGMFLVLIFTRYRVDPRAMVRSEGNTSLKNPVTPPGIVPGTVRLKVQRLNH
jgi:hypothetical protein